MLLPSVYFMQRKGKVMYKIKETYTDYLGVERTEEFYFNFNKAELIKLELSVGGGMLTMLKTLIEKKNIPEMIKVFDMIIDKSYGVRTPDGRGFVKNEEVLNDFKSTEAYSNIFMRFATDAKFASDFVNNIIPKELTDEIAKMSEDDKKALIGDVIPTPTK